MRGRLRVCVVSHAAGNQIGDSGCSALSQALPHLSALQQLNLGCELILFILFCLIVLDFFWGWMRGRLRVCVISRAAGNEIGPSGCSALAQALPHLTALQRLNLGCNLILFILFCLIVLCFLG
jgi:hypothetical protein